MTFHLRGKRIVRNRERTLTSGSQGILTGAGCKTLQAAWLHTCLNCTLPNHLIFNPLADTCLFRKETDPEHLRLQRVLTVVVVRRSFLPAENTAPSQPSNHTPMSRTLVFASAFSRLHADLIIVRLKRAGISPSLISVIHPLSSCPNSAVCWLGGSTQLRLKSGEKIATSGFLRSLFENLHHAPIGASFDEVLSNVGLPHDHRVSLEETLLENRVAVAIDATDKVELPTIFQTLQRSGAEKIFALDIAPSTRRKLAAA
jgi:hypothetical protein